METRTLAQDYSSNVDTSRPFRSVKEAVAVFGERLLLGEFYSTKPFISYNKNNDNNSNPCKEIVTSWKYSSPSPSPQNPTCDCNNKSNNSINIEKREFLDSLKKLEAELEETKMELKMLKERESETEIALATLNAELHKNMSKLAEAEAVAAAKKAVTATTAMTRVGSERTEDLMVIRMEDSPTLAEILSIGEKFGGKKEKKMGMKKRPIVPLVTDLFFKKKGSPNTLHNPLYTSSNIY